MQKINIVGTIVWLLIVQAIFWLGVRYGWNMREKYLWWFKANAKGCLPH